MTFFGKNLPKYFIMSQYTITRQEAIDYTTAWRNDNDLSIKAFKMDKAEMEQIFEDNPTATGVRSYLAIKEDSGEKEYKLVMVATDSEGNDILDSFYDHTVACPPTCDSESVLNTGE